jgi:hypothetical protein
MSPLCEAWLMQISDSTSHVHMHVQLKFPRYLGYNQSEGQSILDHNVAVNEQ